MNSDKSTQIVSAQANDYKNRFMAMGVISLIFGMIVGGGAFGVGIAFGMMLWPALVTGLALFGYRVVGRTLNTEQKVNLFSGLWAAMLILAAIGM